ncbi:hypothetical protein CQW23_15158 [Capsicum baccatum]|uniref:PROP1-like PPR domain-containing protein n=1 Tax=Capsicum baccatum TaxID=33114 RepID=A0A2G2WLG6_CAPBA|nr:hypothetical protein CQW23_15158 [Capsicum baccatum]
MGRQKGFRHRTPLKQRNIKENSIRLEGEYSFLAQLLIEIPEREMSLVLASGSTKPKLLWEFLKRMSRRGLLTTPTITYLIKVLGGEGLVNEALATFYRMKQFHLQRDVYAHNTLVVALCRVGNFKKAKFMMEQMGFPGFRCLSDVFTYTILISSYCRIERASELLDDMVKRGIAPYRITYNSFIRYYSATNEIDKAIEMLRKMQVMNHGVLPCNSSYTPIIHALCETCRVVEARDFLVELAEQGSIPREYTNKLVCEALESAGMIDLLDAEFCTRLEDSFKGRIKQVMKIKPLLHHESV